MINLQPKEIVAFDSEQDEAVFQLEMFDEHTATLKVPAVINPSNWPEISAKIAEALAIMFPDPASPSASEIKEICKRAVGLRVKIEWEDGVLGWPTYYVLSHNDTKVGLRGFDPEKSSDHQGSEFHISYEAIKTIQICDEAPNAKLQ